MTRLEKSFLYGWCAGGLFVGSVQLLSDASYKSSLCLFVYSIIFMLTTCGKKLDYRKNKRDTVLAEIKPQKYESEELKCRQKNHIIGLVKYSMHP